MGGRVAGKGIVVTGAGAGSGMGRAIALGLAREGARLGVPDVMFDNAGLNRPMRLLDVTEDNRRSIMDVDALGVLIGMTAREHGSLPDVPGTATGRRPRTEEAR